MAPGVAGDGDSIEKLALGTMGAIEAVVYRAVEAGSGGWVSGRASCCWG